MENLINLLKKIGDLKAVKPDLDFIVHSRRTILNFKKQPHYQVLFRKELKQIFTLTLAMGMAAILLFSTVNIFRIRLNGSPNQLIKSLNKQDLTLEKQGFNVGINLAEVKYYKESTNQITLALESILDSNHPLNSADVRKQTEMIDLLIKEL
jgi:hypothetical protein